MTKRIASQAGAATSAGDMLSVWLGASVDGEAAFAHAFPSLICFPLSAPELPLRRSYDLLDPAHESKSLEELPRVILLEGERGAVHFKVSSFCLMDEEAGYVLLCVPSSQRGFVVAHCVEGMGRGADTLLLFCCCS